MALIDDYVAAVLADSPVAFWKLNESSGLPQDSSGAGRHFTSSAGAPTYGIAGPFTGASAIRLPAAASFSRAAVSTQADNFTLELWLNIETAPSAANGAIFSNYITSPLGGWELLLQTTRTLQAIAQNVAFLTASGAIAASAWHHIVIVRNAGTWRYYIDAIESASMGTTTPVQTPNTTRIIAPTGSSILQSLVAYYNAPLSWTRINAHYTAAGLTLPSGGAGRFSQTPTEAVYTPIPAGRSSQQPVEVLVTPLSGAVVEQLPVEIVAANQAPPPQLSYWKVGVLTVPAGGGTQTITGLGKRPKALVFMGANWTAEDTVVTSSGTAVFRGMAAPNRWDSPGTIVQDAAAVGPGDQHRETAAAIMNISTAGDATVLYQATVVSFNSDGFTLSWSTGAGGGYKVVYAALFEVDNCAAYRGAVSATLAGVGFKAGAAIVQGSWAGPDFSGNNRSQEWYGGGAYPSGASGNWFGVGMSVQCFPTSQGQQFQCYLDIFDPTILTVSAQHFTGPFLTGSNIKAHPSGVYGEDFVFTGDGENGGMAMFWDDPDSKTGYATADATPGNVVPVSLPFDPGMVLGYSVSDEPRQQGTGGRGAAGFSVMGFDADGEPFQWGALVDRINPGAVQSFAKIPIVVHDANVHSFSGELVPGGFEMTTVDVAASPTSWAYHAFGHPFPPPTVGAWVPQIYRRVRSY